MAVRTIEDIVAIESRPYDELVTAQQPLRPVPGDRASMSATRKALTVLRSPDPTDVGVSLTHRATAGRGHAGRQHVPRARADAGAAASRPSWRRHCPSCRPLLLGAQVAGIASSLNYLLTRDAIFDLLNAQQATILVIPSRDLDETCWSKAAGRVRPCSVAQHVIVIGGDGEGACRLSSAWTKPSRGCRSDALDFEPFVRPRHGLRAVPYRRHDRPAETGAADARQPDPRRVRLRPGVRL